MLSKLLSCRPAVSAVRREFVCPFSSFSTPPGGNSYPNHPNKVYEPFQASNSPVKNTDIDKMFGPNTKLKPRKVPVQLRNTGDAGDGGLEGVGSRLLIDTRLRKGPY